VAISNGTQRTILFLCVHNAGRSQMAAGFARHLGGDNIRVYSRGSEPSDRINPAAIAAIAEIGIDIATQTPRRWTDEIIASTDVVVTMGCGDTCPFFPGVRYVDWALDDPAGKDVNGVRPIRDEIEQRVQDLLTSLDIEPT
jgi:arsenate reductase